MSLGLCQWLGRYVTRSSSPMNDRHAKVPFVPSHSDLAVILYDGDCGLCRRFIDFVLACSHTGTFRTTPLQSTESRQILTRHDRDSAALDTIYVLPEASSSQLLERAFAVLFIVRHLNWPWRALGVIRMFPSRWLNRGYLWVANNRYRLFSRWTACGIEGCGYKQQDGEVRHE